MSATCVPSMSLIAASFSIPGKITEELSVLQPTTLLVKTGKQYSLLKQYSVECIENIRENGW